MMKNSRSTVAAPVAFLLATVPSLAACGSLTLDPIVPPADGGASIPDGASGGPSTSPSAPTSGNPEVPGTGAGPVAQVPTLGTGCSSDGLGPAGGEVVLCGLGADIAVAAATEEAVVIVARSATKNTASRIVLASGVATMLAEWPRHPVYDVSDEPFDPTDSVESNGEVVLVPGTNTDRVFPIAAGQGTDWRNLGTLGRSIADGIAYSAYVSDPGAGSVAALVLRPPQTISDLWTGPHPWDMTERVVGVGGGQLYLSLPAQVTYDGETRPGRALARMPITGGTPVTVVDSDFQGTGRNRDIFRRSVVTSDGTAYFAIDRGIVGMATVTGSPKPLAISDEQDSFGIPESLRVADGYLYFMDRTSEAFTSNSLVRRVKIATRRMEPALNFGRSATAPVVIGQTLFTTIRRGGGLTPEEGVVVRKRF